MYTVVQSFILPEDSFQLYQSGDAFPREGFQASPDLVEQLLGNGGNPLIRENKPAKAEKPAEKPEPKKAAKKPARR